MKIIIIGTTGSGKTTLAKKLSSELSIPHVELDALFWEPNWTQAQDKVYRERVQNAVLNESWVIDGNYSLSRDLVWPKAEIAIWLDYPFRILLKHLLKRTISNIRTQKDLWPGCKESIRKQFFSRNSIFIWFARSCLKKRNYKDVLTTFPNLRVIHVQHPSELEDILFLKD